MDAGDLRIFEAVARSGAMSRAAAELNTVQSNVTGRIRALEAELGAALFERHSRGVRLTQAGERLLPYAICARDLIAEAKRAVADDGTPRGRLTIGSLETTAAMRLAPVLSSYIGSWPEVDLVLRTGTTCELIAAVRERQLEGAFVCGPIEDAELMQEKIFEEELVLVTRRGLRGLDALGREGEVKIVVLRAGCSYRQRLEEILARRGIADPRRLEFGTLEAILACVGAGLGVTLLPKALVAAGAGRVGLHALPAAEARVETVFVRRRDAYVSSALAAFLDLVRPGGAHAEAAE